eukprot:9582774-Heterocapsa_arctica.AAC.1
MFSTCWWVRIVRGGAGSALSGLLRPAGAEPCEPSAPRRGPGPAGHGSLPSTACSRGPPGRRAIQGPWIT